MIGTFNCIFETPCGWCSKWDKKCDKTAGKKLSGATKTEPYNTIDITLSSTPVDKTCGHASTKTNS